MGKFTGVATVSMTDLAGDRCKIRRTNLIPLKRAFSDKLIFLTQIRLSKSL